MDEERRYAIRRGAVELTRRQWVVLGSLLAVGVVAGVVLLVTASASAGGVAFGLTGLVVGLSAAVRGRWPPPRG